MAHRTLNAHQIAKNDGPSRWLIPVNRAGYIAIEVVERINHETVDQFSKRKIMPEQSVYTDAFRGLTSLAKTQEHISRVTPTEKVDEWLPWVHIVISHLKRFLRGTFHGVQGKY